MRVEMYSKRVQLMEHEGNVRLITVSLILVIMSMLLVIRELIPRSFKTSIYASV